ncbi:MAG: hypothetical protein RLZZ336_1860 [Cyanobacteriota bacterium]|jgi:sulfur relay (sulfurtransferase) complex TusBCD TusD component (DsrE family)
MAQIKRPGCRVLLGSLALALAVPAIQLPAPALAQHQEPTGSGVVQPTPGARPLFINLTSDDAHRALMAIGFGENQLKAGHPLTIYLNDRGVLLVSRTRASQFSRQQEQLQALHKAGAQILVCPMCMKHFGVSSADLIGGAQMSNPRLANQALFRPGSVSLSW